MFPGHPGIPVGYFLFLPMFSGHPGIPVGYFLYLPMFPGRPGIPVGYFLWFFLLFFLMAVPFSQRSRQPCSRARKHTHKIREDILGLGLPDGVEEKSPQNHHGQKKLRKLPPVFHFYADQKSCKNRREDQKLKQVHVFAKHLIQLALIDALNNGRKITAVKLINPEGPRRWARSTGTGFFSGKSGRYRPDPSEIASMTPRLPLWQWRRWLPGRSPSLHKYQS